MAILWNQAVTICNIFLFTFSVNQVNIMHDKYALNNFTFSKMSLFLKAGGVNECLQHPVCVAFLEYYLLLMSM